MNAKEIHFGERLKRLYKQSELTGEMAANKFGIARNNFYNYFKSKHLSTQVLVTACDVFNVAPAYFFGPSFNLKKEENIFTYDVTEYGSAAATLRLFEERLEACNREKKLLQEQNQTLRELLDSYKTGTK